MDKVIMKDIFKANNIPCVDYLLVTHNNYKVDKDKCLKSIIDTIDFPLIVKPCNLGSSIGIEKANNITELEDALEIAFYYDRRVIVEQCLTDFKEINISCLGNETCELSCLEQPVLWKDFLNFEDKYTKKEVINRKILNPSLEPFVEEKIKDIAIKLFKIFDLSGVVRIDFMVKEDKVFVNEINTVPGSLAFYLWKGKNVEYFELIDKLISLAIQKFKEQNLNKYNFNSNVLENYEENKINKYSK